MYPISCFLRSETVELMVVRGLCSFVRTEILGSESWTNNSLLCDIENWNLFVLTSIHDPAETLVGRCGDICMETGVFMTGKAGILGQG